jgi:succinate dehydrogenase / fumarate reductase membrane anchor subunit
MLRKTRVPGWHWVLQRVSALLLVVGLAGHFLVLHYTKLFGSRAQLSFDSTQARFSGHPRLWLLFDAMMLAAVLYHALNGTYNIIVDYAPRPCTKKALAWVLWAVGLGSFALGFVLLGRFISFALGR